MVLSLSAPLRLMRLAGDDATRRESPAEPKQQDAPVHFAVLSRVVEDPTRICGIRCPLLLSASVKTYPSEMMLTNCLGTDRCGAVDHRTGDTRRSRQHRRTGRGVQIPRLT